jgi:hypothetical protein
MMKAKIINPMTNKSVMRFGEFVRTSSSDGVGVGNAISAGALYRKVNVPVTGG